MYCYVYIHNKIAGKSFANDLTLIAVMKLHIKFILYMEEKYLVCYPVFKFHYEQ